jgi:hypothetical protein
MCFFLHCWTWHYELSFFSLECVVYFLSCGCLVWTHWNQEQHKNVFDTMKPGTGTTQKRFWHIETRNRNNTKMFFDTMKPRTGTTHKRFWHNETRNRNNTKTLLTHWNQEQEQHKRFWHNETKNRKKKTKTFLTHWNQEQEQHKNVFNTMKPGTGTTQNRFWHIETKNRNNTKTFLTQWNQEQEQEKNIRPHNKKYTTHSKEKELSSQCHIKNARRNM